jgi:hypothetical protein
VTQISDLLFHSSGHVTWVMACYTRTLDFPNKQSNTRVFDAGITQSSRMFESVTARGVQCMLSCHRVESMPKRGYYRGRVSLKKSCFFFSVMWCEIIVVVQLFYSNSKIMHLIPSARKTI